MASLAVSALAGICNVPQTSTAISICPAVGKGIDGDYGLQVGTALHVGTGLGKRF
jgi:hypothetical protein